MQRTDTSYKIKNANTFKKKLLYWSQKFTHAIWLDSNDYKQKHSNFDAVLAVDVLTEIESTSENAFDKLKTYQTEVNDYIFGYLGYDLKNDVEKLDSTNFDGLNFPEMFFFQPKKLIFLHGNTITFKYLLTSLSFPSPFTVKSCQTIIPPFFSILKAFSVSFLTKS